MTVRVVPSSEIAPSQSNLSPNHRKTEPHLAPEFGRARHETLPDLRSHRPVPRRLPAAVRDHVCVRLLDPHQLRRRCAKLFVAFVKTLQFAYLFGIVPALMIGAIDDILFACRAGSARCCGC